MSTHENGDVLRTVIVDDEPLARDCVRLALQGTPGIQVIAECVDGEAAVDAILRLRPDLVFLDVQMPGMDGFDVIDAVGPERMPAVVFVTAYDEHALRAFEVHALDYVLKPFDDTRFREALRHARRFVDSDLDDQLRSRLKVLLEDRKSSDQEQYTGRIMVRVRDRIRIVPVNDVDWFESAGNYVRIRSGTNTFLIRRTLTSLADTLDPTRFVRIHRSTIVNLDRIQELQPAAGGDYIAILKDGRKLRVSRAFREALIRD
jgi:two-component system LytT family response regulator